MHNDAATLERNQSLLAARLDYLRAHLEAYARGETLDEADPPEEAPALADLGASFGLGAFERDVVLLACAAEYDGTFSDLFVRAHNERHPSFSLAFAALPHATWSAMQPNAPLRFSLLIEMEPASVTATAPLRANEAVMNYVAGSPHLDERLVPFTDPVRIDGYLSPSQRAVAERIVDLWGGNVPRRSPVQLCGEHVATKRLVAAEVAAALGLGLIIVRACVLPTSAVELDRLVRLIARDAVLLQSCVLMEFDDVAEDDRRALAVLVRAAESLRLPLFMSTGERRRTHARPFLTYDVGRPTTREQEDHWSIRFVEHSIPADHARRVIGHYDLDLNAIDRICSALPAGANEDDIWNVAREQTRPRLEDLAQPLRSGATWDDLIVGPQLRRALDQIVTHVSLRQRVSDAYGFGRTGRADGIATLFSGSSGTGKTLAAEVLANELHLDLYRIDLSSTVSKYIGETEKNLRRIFDAAESTGAILLFDEADALFGRRSDVKDSHDRHANMEVSYLLQRIEAYRGLAILTSNLPDSIDQAFLRRFRFVLTFEFPEAEQRTAIWRRILPPESPCEALDYARLGQLRVAGGTIRTIAINAAFAAAAQDRLVRMDDVLVAARAEYTKLDRTISGTELQGWRSAPVAHANGVA